MTTNFSNADFDSIREDLKRFLAERTEFRDFNFDGSAISVLLGALAYTSNYMAVHANMSLTEAFLDSCQLRGSAVSHAKSLGYFPRQKSAARARVKLTYVHPTLVSGITNISLPEGSRFSGGVTENAFEFVSTESIFLLEEQDAEGNLINPGTYVADVAIREGTVRARSFTYPNTSLVPKFTVPDTDLDTDYFRVFVQQIGDPSPTEHFRSTFYVDIENDSRVFFFQEGLDESIEFTFGDGVIGFRPGVGSTITISYLTTDGPVANGASSFDLVTSLQEGVGSISPNLVTVDTLEQAGYGAEKQDLEGIRFTAPKAYAAQNRAVTEGDYIALLLREFGFIQSISVWGGEQNDPPLYGKVLVSIRPINGDILSPLTKEQIKETVLDKFSVVGIIPEIVDPDYTFIEINSKVSYEKERTFLSDAQIVDLIVSAVDDYFLEAVTKFNSRMRFSQLVSRINSAEPSILGNETTYTMIKRFKPVPFAFTKLTLGFGNPVLSGSVTTNEITTVTGAKLVLRDSNGYLDAYVNGALLRRSVGSIDYIQGKVTLSGFSFDVPDNTTVEFRAAIDIARSQDLQARRNNLIVVDKVLVNLDRFFRRQTSDQL